MTETNKTICDKYMFIMLMSDELRKEALKMSEDEFNKLFKAYEYCRKQSDYSNSDQLSYKRIKSEEYCV
jgi:hypothetical protein